VDDRRNLLRLCQRCHALAEGERIREPSGELAVRLNLAACLWLKKESDPEWYDLEALQRIAGKWRLPEPEEPARCSNYRPR
jgi:hypothetical protein